jgi:signal transduction histidine kinase
VLVLGAEGEILAHRSVLPLPLMEERPLAGRRVGTLDPPALGELLQRLWTQCRASGLPATAEIVLAARASSGRPLWLSVQVAPCPGADDLSAVTLRDLTVERGQARGLLDQIGTLREQRDRWESKARVVAHDVRSSLSAVKGFIELALRHAPDLSAQASKCLGQAVEISERLRSVAAEVVGSNHSREKALEKADLGQLGHRLMEALAAARPEVPFTWCVETGGLEAAMPGGALWDVLWNLLINAVEYRSEERELHVELRSWRADGEIWIEVRDNGRGLEPGEEEVVFSQDRRGTSSAGTEGSGLGLFSVRSLVEQAGGRVWAEALRCGAAFRIVLPAPKGPG